MTSVTWIGVFSCHFHRARCVCWQHFFFVHPRELFYDRSKWQHRITVRYDCTPLISATRAEPPPFGTILYYTILNYTILYYTILYYTILYRARFFFVHPRELFNDRSKWQHRITVRYDCTPLISATRAEPLPFGNNIVPAVRVFPTLLSTDRFLLGHFVGGGEAGGARLPRPGHRQVLNARCLTQSGQRLFLYRIEYQVDIIFCCNLVASGSLLFILSSGLPPRFDSDARDICIHCRTPPVPEVLECGTINVAKAGNFREIYSLKRVAPRPSIKIVEELCACRLQIAVRDSEQALFFFFFQLHILRGFCRQPSLHGLIRSFIP